MQRTLTRSALLTLLVVGSAPVFAATPVSGGANQVRALSANLGDTVFNGELRMTITELRETTDPEAIRDVLPSASQRVMTMKVLLRNGTHDRWTGLLSYTFADKDDVAVQIADGAIAPANLNILQGAAQRGSGNFALDKDFVPVKLIVQCQTCPAKTAFRPIRFRIASLPLGL